MLMAAGLVHLTIPYWLCRHLTLAKLVVEPSWVADLNAYIAGQQGSPTSSSTDGRVPLVAAVKSNPQSAEAWGALLAHEEAHGSSTTHGLHSASDSSKITLYHLYIWATQLVPRSRDGMYLQLWLGYAKQQW